MPNVVKTSIVVQFADDVGDADLLFKAEIDSREDGLNNGKTAFAPGDSAGILLYKSPEIISLTTDNTAGSLVPASQGTIVIEREELIFDDNETPNQEYSLNYPVDSNFTYKWLGRDGGPLQLVKNTKVVKPNAGIGVALVSYTTRYYGYRLTSPAVLNDESEFSIIVLFIGSTL